MDLHKRTVSKAMRKNKNRTGYLLKNTAIFAIGNISTKLIAFFLVPFYTYVLTTEEYGIINLVFTICSVISPFLMLNLHDAVRRFALDENADYNAILTTEWIVILVGHVLGLLVFPVLHFFPSFGEYRLELYFFLVSLTANVIFLEYLRGREKMKAYVICSIYSALCVALLNIAFLVGFHLGIKGYLFAYILSYISSSILAVFLGRQYDVIHNWKYDNILSKEMIKFSIPMIPNSLLWWISSSSDHIMVSYFISAAANGVYTVSYKIPTMITTVSNIFMQAWQISAIKESGAKDNTEYSNKMLDGYIRFCTLLTAFLLIVIKPFLKIYVSDAFFAAWEYTPFLIVGYAFSTIGTFVGTNYYVQKDMRGNMYSAGAGAVSNIILNILLIPTLGVQGAAIATCCSYIIVFIYRVFDTRKYLILDFKKREYAMFLVIILFLLGLAYVNGVWHYLIMCSLFMVLLFMNIVFIKGFLAVQKKSKE